MIYTFSSKNRGSKFLDIELIVENNSKDIVFVQLPAWRPGRYELANFAKNIQQFEVKSMNNKPLEFKKVSKDKWEVKTNGLKQFKVVYNYYANELNAGSTWVDEHQIYVNPVNCCVFIEGREKDPVKIFLNEKKGEKVAIGLQKIGNHYVAESFDELADSPFILSDNIQHETYKVGKVKFHLWFQGECKPNWKKLKKDFKAFSNLQLEVMGRFPFKEYHFMYQILPQKAYHGVEHLTSTVISFGPGFGIMEGADYEEVLGVSSHELFHAWNIKSIRPSDLFPYDFTEENYSRMGYLAEGVTTYYGDLMLKRSGVFSQEQFVKQINKTLDRHFYNYGVFNLSVADSSFDTWLDGYQRGIPNRKSSIYTEGCLLAMTTDLIIRSSTGNKKSMDNVLYKLYHDFALKGKGVTEKDYFNVLQTYAKVDLKSIWDNFYYGKGDYFDLMKPVLAEFGFDLIKSDNPKYLASKYGLYTSPGTDKVLFVAPNSPGERAGVNVGDEIVSINDILVEGGNSNDWANYFEGKISITLKKDGFMTTVDLKASSKSYFPKVKIAPLKNIGAKAKKNQSNWLNN